MAWYLSYPKNVTQDSLLAWAEEQIKQGVPRQIICDFLLKNVSHFNSVAEMEFTLKSESQLSGVMLERNLKGREHEKAGNIETAIKLYEANVLDWFSGNFPYERLRTIYLKQKRFDDAIRVCKAFITVTDFLLDGGSERGDLVPKREKFLQWIEEMEQKKHGKSKSSI